MQPKATIAEDESASADQASMEPAPAQESSQKVSSMQQSKEESPEEKRQRKKLVKEVRVSSSPHPSLSALAEKTLLSGYVRDGLLALTASCDHDAEGGPDEEEEHQGAVQGVSLQHQAGPDAWTTQNRSLGRSCRCRCLATLCDTSAVSEAE